MPILRKVSLPGLPMVGVLAAALLVSACTSPSRFDNAGAGAGAGGDSLGSLSGGAVNPSSPIYFQQSIGDRVYFAVDSQTLNAEAQAVLAGQAEWLRQNPDYRAVIEGHADERGTREYNLALGAKRANAAMEYLVSLGVARDRLQFVSYGKERPAEICSDESCYGVNRRAVTVIAATAFTG